MTNVTHNNKDIQLTNINKEIFDKSSEERKKRSKLSILVVEDEEFSSNVIINILKSYGDIISARNGEDAIKIYEEKAPDITFIDLGLPDITGFNVLSSIIEVDEDSFCVVITAFNSSLYKERSINMGAKEFIIKPCSKESIEQCLIDFNKSRAL